MCIVSLECDQIDKYGGYCLINNPIRDDEGFDKNNFEVWFEGLYVDSIKGYTYDSDYDNVVQLFRNWVDFGIFDARLRNRGASVLCRMSDK